MGSNASSPSPPLLLPLFPTILTDPTVPDRNGLFSPPRLPCGCAHPDQQQREQQRENDREANKARISATLEQLEEFEKQVEELNKAKGKDKEEEGKTKK
jgi:hypothetical protein